MVVVALSILSLLPLALGRPFTQPKLQVHAPSGFHSTRFPILHASQIRFTLALAPQNIGQLHSSLLDVSDPTSTTYGKFLSKETVEQLVAPTPESVQAVTDWLKDSNITSTARSPAGDMLQIQIPLDKANELLTANYTAYVHESTHTTMWRTLSYTLPPNVAQHLSFIYPTTQFIPPPTRKAAVRALGRIPASAARTGFRRADVPATCAQAITPACLQALYNIPSTPATSQGNSLGVSGFDSEVANLDDLKTFLADQRPDFPNGTFTVQAVDGGSDDGQGTPEASLDIQYTVGLATNVPTTFISVGPETEDGIDGFMDIINTLLAAEQPPMVLTTSFGFDETPLTEQAPELAQALCNAYAQLGARGTSVIFASGDGGVSGSQANSACDGAAFIPTFPASCPYVTAVGSTQGINPETAAPFSAGGFSNIFPRPAYQTSAVAAYLENLGSAVDPSLFNATGRAYPDVSTQGVEFTIEVAGEQQAVDGTSASSPTFASVVALLNDRRLAAGQSPLGFLNPLLYSHGVAALNDITSGSNPGCGTSGFPAAAGWDPVTGLGTPNFQKLLAVVTGSAGAVANVTKGVAAAPVKTNTQKKTSHKRELELRPGPGGIEIIHFDASSSSTSTTIVTLPAVSP